jgi:predicted nucleic acid-binding Zn ribbon protein
VSTAAPPEAPAPPPGTIHCARCGAAVPADQDWCLECGHHARTVISGTPRWKVPLIVAASIAALALAALAVAFVDLTEDPEGGTATTPTTAPPAQTAPPPVETAPTTPTTPPPAPGTTTPTTPAPGQTTPAPGAEPTTPTPPPTSPSATPGAEPANP